MNFSLAKDGTFNKDWHKEYIKVTLDEGIKTVFTSGYDGSPIGSIFKEAGSNWIHKCATIKHAISIARKGPDAVVIVGLEGTGYKSPEQHSTLINITTARRWVNVPLIAAGGIADARGFIAALAMGASGIYMGTSFMATREFQAPDTFKKRIVDQDIKDFEYSRKIYQMKHSGIYSLASGVIETVPTVKEYIDNMIKEAEGIMSQFKQWGMFESEE